MKSWFETEAEGGVGWSRQRWGARLAFILLVWMLVGLFFTSQLYFYFLGTPKQMSLPSVLAWQMSAVLIFALSTPLVLLIARRFRIARETWRRTIPIQLLASIVICASWSAFHIFLDTYFSGTFATYKWRNLPRVIFVNIDRELLVYWIIVVISHAADYYQRYREGELRASQAQLQALKMQLHPHFLFNALHSISALVHSDPEAADKMIARLGDFLRLTLDSAAAQEVTLKQELEFLNCYLDIERTRFRDRLTTQIEADPQVLDSVVPNLILQPIVENAIRHGVSQRAAHGHVEVRASRVGQVLRLEVRDNGRGLPEGAEATRAKQGGVGLANTRARLQQLYGGSYRFELTNAPEGGAIVTLEIPLHDSASDPASPAEADAEQTPPFGAARPAGARGALSSRA